ncbi:MAG: SPOR domain-containing protein [Candidatus Competibacteraceae bacterium]
MTISLESETPPADSVISEPVSEEPQVTAPDAESLALEPADDTSIPPPIATAPKAEMPLPVEAESTLPVIEEPAPVEPAPSLAPRPTVKPVDVTKKPEPVRPKPATPPLPPAKPTVAKPSAPPPEKPAPKVAETRQPPEPAKPAKAPPSAPPEKTAKTPPPPPKKTTPPAQIALPKVELIGRASTPPSKNTANTQVAKASSTARGGLPPVDLVAQPRATEPRARPSDGGRWIVQVGSFSLQQNASNLRNRLRQRNFNAYVEPVRVSGQTMYRVRVGPQNSRAASEQMLTRLRQAGVSSGQVVSLR